MRFSKEQNKKHLELVRRYLVRIPEASVMQLAEMTSLSRDYVSQLKRKIEGERANRINYQVLSTELAKIEDTFNELTKECWKIIQDNTSNFKEKVNAINALRSNITSLMESKFNAGVFRKKLGEVDIREISVKIIKNADKSDNNIPAKL